MTAPDAAFGVPLAVRTSAEAPSPAADGDEAALVERVRAGDAAAFDALAGRYMRRAYSVAYRLMGQKEDAEDLVQETFIAVLQRIDTFEAGRPFAPWFFRVLVNRGLNARKSRTLRAVDEIPEATAHHGPSAARPARPSGRGRAVDDTPAAPGHPAPPPARGPARGELRDRLRAAMGGLPERQRTIVELFELEGFSGTEIADILEISDGTVRWHMHEARKTLRKALAPYERSR